MDAINAYEAELKRWKRIEYNAFNNSTGDKLYYIVRGDRAMSGLLNYTLATSALETMSKRAAEEAAARAEETMQISLPDWWSTYFGEEGLAA